ncbi:hypothetical protein FNV43_RR16283 [Rhamnella rubrinervis]|uniref:Uncharacterized protein n=1 Tax=Rhamnella rubrinervis TaxID=2594499 RepID=A0A8K0GYH4_9ROSA|nr:hypothetical protein FNV43_RR16283 [Rhamnella rubrinervis]
MEDSRICENDLIGKANHGFDPNRNENSQRLFDVVKCSMLKLVLAGADKLVRDRRKMKSHLSLANGIALQEYHFTSTEGEEVRGENAFEEKVDRVQTCLQENQRVCVKSGNTMLSSSKDYLNRPHVVNSHSRNYNQFPVNYLTFSAVMLMKIIGFQLSLFISSFTFPLRVTYVCIMSLLFPLQTIRQIRVHLMKKLLRMWGVTHLTVTSAVSKRVKAQKSLAVRIGFAFFKSIYVFSMLFWLRASGFVLGGFMMRHLVEKPIQIRERLNFNYSKTSPVAFAPIIPSGAVNPSTLLSKDNAEAGKHNSGRIIPYNHKLQVTVSLTVPESEHNMKLGIFQVTDEFLSANGNVTASSSHPCMLKFKSLPIRFAETLIKSAPLIAGFQSESQVLHIQMTEFTEGL